MNIQKAVVGGGCFWCLEAIFNKLKGVQSVVSGYSGGTTSNPSYTDICTGTTGHAEVIQIEFDADVIDFSILIYLFFVIHDPTTLNRQGNDVGTQYRSIVLYQNHTQKQIVEDIISELESTKTWQNPVTTELKQFEMFFSAEHEHQDYYANNPSNPYCNYFIPPKLDKAKKYFEEFFQGSQ